MLKEMVVLVRCCDHLTVVTLNTDPTELEGEGTQESITVFVRLFFVV